MKIQMEINNDFGDWEDIEQFKWSAYGDELADWVRGYLDAPVAEVAVEFRQCASSSIWIDGESPIDAQYILERAFHAVDATCERFYA